MMAKMGTMLTSLVVLLACCVFSILGQEDERPVVQTKYGKIRGRVRVHSTGAKVNEFLGVPYAAPPVGDLRFKKTVKPENFAEDIFEADKMPPACHQYSDQPLPWYDLDPGQSEDCLYLNIWAPAIPYKNRQTTIYVHGGGWFEGGSNRMGYYDGFGDALDTMDENGTSLLDGVVVVTVNYRLGALGYLASGMPDEAAGNMGLFDLAQAFQWVWGNIASISKIDTGDYRNWGTGVPNRNLTLVGQGSGAMAVSLLRTSVTKISVPSYLEELKMILNGASFLTLKALEGVDEEGNSYVNNLRLTNMLADALDCPTPLWKNRNATITCLKGVEASRLVKAAASLSKGIGPPNVFLPQTKGPDMFFFLNPYTALHSFPFRYNDVLATVTTDEGSHLLTSAFPKTFGVFGEKDVLLSAACAKTMTRKLLKKFPRSVADELLGDLDPKPTAGNKKKVVEAIGDAFFNCPMVHYMEETILSTWNNRRESHSRPYLLEKQLVYPPYNPWAPWMGSVGFNNVQIDLVHPDGQLTLGNQTYKFTDEQSKQAQVLKKNIKDPFQRVSKESMPFYYFFNDEPTYRYGILWTDGRISKENQTNFHKNNCDILRPYFSYN